LARYLQQQYNPEGWNTTLFIDLLSALSAPVKALKTNASSPAERHSLAADSTGLPANKSSSVKGFAETLGHAQVKFLSPDDVETVKQSLAQDPGQRHANESLSEEASAGELNAAPVEAEEIPAAIFSGNGLPVSGKSASAEVMTQVIQNSSQPMSKPVLDELAIARIETGTSETENLQEHAHWMTEDELPDATARINDSWQTHSKAALELPGATTAVASDRMPRVVSIDPIQTPTGPAVLRSSRILEGSAPAQKGIPKPQPPIETTKVIPEPELKAAPADLIRRAEITKPAQALNAGGMTGSWTAGNRSDSLGVHPAEPKPILQKEELTQLGTSALKSAYTSAATKSSNETVTVTRNELPGFEMQQDELKARNSQRGATDLLQARVDAQPINTASLMQRHVEQRLASQGTDTKRLQSEVAAALETRVSVESSDRAPLGLTKVEPATSVMPKQAAAPALADSPSSPRQMDTAVQDQILRVMSRQALTQGRLTLQLNPHELGSLDIEFSTEKGEVQVAIVARETSTRDLLEASVARLRQSLQEGGVNVGQLDIRQGDRQSDEQGARESMHQKLATDRSAPGSLHKDGDSQPHVDEGGIHIYV